MISNRKFNLTCTLIGLNFILLMLSKITAEQWMNMCLMILGAYLTSNVTQKIWGKTND